MEDYGKYSDEELLSQFGKNKPEIMEYLLGKYKPLVRKKANALYLIGGDTDDLIQEGMIGLFKAVESFDGEKDSSFFHFAELCITRQMYSAVEASRRKKHAPLNSYISLYDEAGENGVRLADVLSEEGEKNPERMFIDRETFLQDLEKLSENLSTMERQVLDGILEGLNYKQIAAKLGRSPKAIDNALQRIKRKV
ncbi:MAG: sigma-70 family RNA polymerase sigma factor [Roseburia sp.]|nr:sigma-70 family RNA polymerase sigma factor [Roseburia sp.]